MSFHEFHFNLKLDPRTRKMSIKRVLKLFTKYLFTYFQNSMSPNSEFKKCPSGSLMCRLYHDYFLKKEDNYFCQVFEQNGMNRLLIRSKLIMTNDFMNRVKCITIIDVFIEFIESLKFTQKLY